MKLTEFRILNFRSINDSGPIEVGKLTSLVGRNESGKTNLLLALKTLNPPGGAIDLNKIKDFPRHRRLSECSDNTEVVSTTWEFSDSERAELTAMFPRAAGVTRVQIGRRYKVSVWVRFVDLKPIAFNAADVETRFRKLRPVLEAHAEKLEAGPQAEAKAAISKLATDLTTSDKPETWAQASGPSLAHLRKVFASVGITIPDREDGLLGEMEATAAAISADGPAWTKARSWASSRLPLFVYVSEYPELTGHQNIDEFLSRKQQPNQVTDTDRNFEKMCKVAGLDPQELQTLHRSGDHETRNQLANRAGAVVTSELRRLWKDRELKVQFSPDAQHLDTFVADPNSLYDVEVNLDERSRGLKWFFSFYITFSADTKGGAADNAILLLDEPGLYLHALSQGDLLRHFDADFKNQIIYTTHSPFMVPTENLDAIRTVNIEQDAGTTVTATPAGDFRTLFPLQMALGFSLSQSLFIGPSNLIVEGVTDFWYLSTVSEYLSSKGVPALPKGLVITPAGGAQKVGYMVALLTSQRLRVLLLLDEEKQARKTFDDLVKAKLIQDTNVLFMSDAFSNPPAQADIEDLLDAAVFDALVAESYKKELQGKSLSLNVNIPRIVKRYEDAFSALGLEFHKTRPARLFIEKMAHRSSIRDG